MQKPKHISKVLLRNTILQTDSHNRALEEEECWRQYEALRAGHVYINNATDAGNVATAGYHDNRTKLVESSLMKGCDRQAHMDDVDEVRPRVYGGRDGEQANTSTFWLRKLESAESADPNRWDHSGYKELYPEEFQMTSSSTSDNDGHTAATSQPNSYRHRKRKRVKSSSLEGVHKHKSKHKKGHRHKKKKRVKKDKKNKHA